MVGLPLLVKDRAETGANIPPKIINTVFYVLLLEGLLHGARVDNSFR